MLLCDLFSVGDQVQSFMRCVSFKFLEFFNKLYDFSLKFYVLGVHFREYVCKINMLDRKRAVLAVYVVFVFIA